MSDTQAGQGAAAEPPPPPTGEARSINCTKCGAGLPVLGGGRVTTQVCGYCGAALDATDAYRVLAVYAGMERPVSPFRPGMTGTLDGVDWTIIGTLGMQERWEGQIETWVDHMLYSPTHGYAWLTLEDGHTVLTRKTRHWPSDGWLTSRSVENAEKQPRRRLHGRSYTYFQTTFWEVTFAEGAFNFRAERGACGTSISLLGERGNRPEMLTLLEPKGAREREVELSQYADGAAQAFGVEPAVTKGVHPLEPYRAAPGAGFYPTWFGVMTLAAIALAVIALTMSRGAERLYSGPVSDLPATVEFEVTDAARPLRLTLGTDIANSWADFDLQVTGPDDVALADTFLPVSYYAGVDWSEGSRRETIGLMPHTTGTHRLTLGAPVGAGAQSGRVGAVELTLNQGLMTARWPVIAAIVFALLFAWSVTGRLRHGWARRRASDWTEED